MSDKWNPKYPDFATRKAGSGLDDGETGDDWNVTDQTGETKPLQWFTPPETSHLHSFAYESARFGSPYFSRMRQKISKYSALHVRFKPSGRTNKVTHYLYRFDNDAQGEAVFDKIRAAAHPGAEVVNAILIAERIPYERLS